MTGVIELLLFTLLVGLALAILRLKDLFAIAMLSGAFSLVSAGLFTMMDAVDVAFTEAAVGAGFTTVLFLGTLALTSRKERQQPFRWGPFLVVLVVGAVLMWAGLDAPVYGDPNAPIHTHLGPDFIARSPTEIDMPNIVTGVLASYRGYDTMGETAVIFTAGVGVLLLLGGRRGGQLDEEDAS